MIDEAHQLIHEALSGGQWHILASAARAAHGLLLLSATPMRGNYGILEALLHLVDPVAFPLGQTARFAERVEERTAELVDTDVLTSRFAMPTDRAQALKRIRDRHPGDPFVEQATDPDAYLIALYQNCEIWKTCDASLGGVMQFEGVMQAAEPVHSPVYVIHSSP